MRDQTKTYLTEFLKKEYVTFPKILDVGSRNISGHIRALFPSHTYTGLDMEAGDNVDIVMNAHDMEYKDEFDIVTCFDTLEHDDKFWVTIEKLKQAVKPGGWLLLGVPGRNCPLHEHPKDYWRFLPEGLRTLLEGFEEISLEVEKDDEVYGKGRKPK